MKRLVRTYTFAPATKQITFGALNAVVLDRLLLIVNATTGDTIYSFADPAKGGTVATNVLTLEYDTTGMNAADKLLIFYEAPDVIDKFVSVEQTLVANTTATLAPSAAGALEPVELSIVNIDGAAAVRFTVDGTDPVTVTGAEILPATPGEVVLPWDQLSASVKLRSPGTPAVKVTLRGRA